MTCDVGSASGPLTGLAIGSRTGGDIENGLVGSIAEEFDEGFPIPAFAGGV